MSDDRVEEIDWRRVGDFRNVLAHGYTAIQLERVWQIITSDLRELGEVVAELDRLPPPPS
jgi:uncharacterized protein with HEPN domain